MSDKALSPIEQSERLLHEITTYSPPAQVLAEAQRAAVALQTVIAAKPKKVIMNNEQYLEFEDWQTAGRFYGMTAKEDGDPEPVEFGDIRGFKASSVVIWKGQVITRATAYCLNDEEKWRSRPKYEYQVRLKNGQLVPEEGSNKNDWVWEAGRDGKRRPKKERVRVGDEPVPLFQLASMAQTRANAKALRNVLAWVVVLAGFKPTPAEELEDLVSSESPPDAPAPDPNETKLAQAKAKAQTRADASPADPPPAAPPPPESGAPSELDMLVGDDAAWADWCRTMAGSDDTGLRFSNVKKAMNLLRNQKVAELTVPQRREFVEVFERQG